MELNKTKNFFFRGLKQTKEWLLKHCCLGNMVMFVPSCSQTCGAKTTMVAAHHHVVGWTPLLRAVLEGVCET